MARHPEEPGGINVPPESEAAMDWEDGSMLDEAFAAEADLTAWELDFVETLDDRREFPLSDRQQAVLRCIIARLR